MIQRMITFLIFILTTQSALYSYVKPNGCSQEVWDEVQPYFLPPTHPAKTSLDMIFGNDRPLSSEKAMKNAGFFKYKQSDKDIIVTGHPRLKGYIIKTYLDTSPNQDWTKWLDRIIGADTIRECINYYGFNTWLKVPKKWIYPLPVQQEIPAGPNVYPKYFVLVAQDMGLVGPDANAYKWKHSITPDYLDPLFVVLTEHRLVDSVYIDNIPFSFDGKIAFVDTEHVDIPPHHYPLRLHILFENLSSKMKSYWNSLITTFPKNLNNDEELPPFTEEESYFNEEEETTPPFFFEEKASYCGVYQKHPNCPEEAYQAVEPYLLPPDHPTRVILNNIFKNAKVLTSEKTMRKAGFTNAFQRKPTGVIVAKHPRLQGYVVKAYLDSFDTSSDWERWSTRAKNALILKESLNQHGYSSMIKVPKKWIYPLPVDSVSLPTEAAAPKYFILIEQDMGVLSKEGNHYHWKHCMTKPLIEALYTIISKHRLLDSVRVANVPFCVDGKVAFIDTEWMNMGPEHGPVRFFKFYDYLSSEMKNHLEQLVNGS